MASFGSNWYFYTTSKNPIDFGDNWRVNNNGQITQYERFDSYITKQVFKASSVDDVDFTKVSSVRAICRDPMGNEFWLTDIRFEIQEYSTYTRYYIYIKPDSRVSEYNTEDDRDKERMIFIFYNGSEPYLYYSIEFTVVKTWGIVYRELIDMYAKALPTHLYLSQDTDEASLVLSLFSSEGVFEAARKRPPGSSAYVNVLSELRGLRADDSEIIIPGIFTEKSVGLIEWATSYVKYPFVTINGLKDLTAVPGDVIFAIVLNWNGTELSSSKCIAHIEPKP